MDEFRKGLEDKPYFNGYYQRDMLSNYGKISDIPIPRFRSSQEDMSLRSMNVFEQEQNKFMKLIEQMHLLGISQRKIKKLVKNCFGFNIGTSKVSKIYTELVASESAQINSKELSAEYEYIMLDGIWEKVKGYGWSNNKKVLLCALGIKADESREIIGFSLQPNEDAESWSILLRELKDRGLNTKGVKLVIGDAGAGLKSALDRYFPNTKFQSCIVHKMRNVMFKCSLKNRPQLILDLKVIFNSRSKQEAEDNAKAFAKKWYVSESKAVEALRFNLEYCLTYFEYPQVDWHRIRTTNLLEREFREVRRRFRVNDNTFQSEESAKKYAEGLFSYLNCNYPLN